jgi:hypothetical protein
MSAASRRLLLVAEAAAELPALAARRGWLLERTVAVPDAAVVETVWRVDPSHTFHHLLSTAYGVHYCQLLGPDADALLEAVSPDLAFLTSDDAVAAFDDAQTAHERAAITHALGVAAGTQPDAEVTCRVSKAMRDPARSVRIAAVDAAYLTGWPTLRERVELLGDGDPDSGVRRVADLALAQEGAWRRPEERP